MRYFFFVLIFILGCEEKPKPNPNLVNQKNDTTTNLVYKALNEPIWNDSTKSDKEKYRFWIGFGMGQDIKYIIRIEDLNHDSLKVVFKQYTCVECNPLISKVTEKSFKIIEAKETVLNKKDHFKWAISHFEFWQLQNNAVDKINICDGTFIGIEGLRSMVVDSNDIIDKAHFKMYNRLRRSCVGSQNPIYELTLYTVNLIGRQGLIDFDTPSAFLQNQEKN